MLSKRTDDRTKKANLLGQHFGCITVIDSAPSRAGGQAYWKCQCDCGTIWEVAANNLLSGKTQSCGCVLSLGEQNISQILKNNHIQFNSQQTFSDLVSDTGTVLRYDFAILNKEGHPVRLIEFDGPSTSNLPNILAEKKASCVFKNTILSKINTPSTIIFL